ncbi:hypothetical protein [Salinirarus marinus]|uniref:hypothetical protein n=1 Tax=Salinirarus marinus TaxID=3068310 RepID=UPI003C6BE1D5
MYIIPEDVLKPSHVDESDDREHELVADGGTPLVCDVEVCESRLPSVSTRRTDARTTPRIGVGTASTTTGIEITSTSGGARSSVTVSRPMAGSSLSDARPTAPG